MSRPLTPERLLKGWRTHLARKLWAVLAGFILLIILFYAEENWRGDRAWETCKAYLTAHNMPTDWSPPKPSNYPADQNFAETSFLKAVGYQNLMNPAAWGRVQILQQDKLLMRLGSEGILTDLKACQADLRRDPACRLPPLPREPALDLLDTLAWIQPTMNELRLASLRPHSAFIIQGHTPFTLVMPNFGAARRLAQLFALDASAALGTGRTTEGFRDLCVIFRLAEAVNSADTLISTMIRAAILGIHTQAFWEGWAQEQWTETEWEEFQQQYHEIDLLRDLDRSLRKGEMGAINFWLSTHSLPNLVKELTGNHPSAAFDPSAWLANIVPHGWVRQNQVVYSHLMATQILEPIDVPGQLVFPSKQAAFQRQLDETFQHWSPFKILASMTVPNMTKAGQTVAKIQTRVKEAEIVCALERYRIKNGKFPTELQALVPSFIEKLPHDLITGEPFKYRLQPDNQFLLYSIGWDEKDDNGTSAPIISGNKVAGPDDWVWPKKPH